MDENVIKLLDWIYSNFGRTGYIIAFFIFIATIIGILWLLQKLPISKEQPLCHFCIYENKNEDSKIFLCDYYKKCRPFQFHAKECLHVKADETVERSASSIEKDKHDTIF